MLSLIERYQFIGERLAFARKQVAPVIDDGLDLEIVPCAAALQGGETRRLDEIAPLFAA